MWIATKCKFGTFFWPKWGMNFDQAVDNGDLWSYLQSEYFSPPLSWQMQTPMGTEKLPHDNFDAVKDWIGLKTWTRDSWIDAQQIWATVDKIEPPNLLLVTTRVQMFHFWFLSFSHLAVERYNVRACCKRIWKCTQLWSNQLLELNHYSVYDREQQKPDTVLCDK